MADTLFVVLLSALSFVLSGLRVLNPAIVLLFASYVWILRRFGLLAWVALVLPNYLIRDLPLVVTSWYAAYSGSPMSCCAQPLP